MIGDGRAEDGPPCDALAETIVLSKLLISPVRIDTVDLATLLVFPDNRLCWQALVLARAQYPEVSSTVDREWSAFFSCWLTGLDAADPAKALAYAAGVMCSDDFPRIREEHEDDCDDESFSVSDHTHPYEWWLARLQRIRQARSLIDAAQEISERAWRVPERSFSFDQADNILHHASMVKNTYEDSGMDIPV